MGVALPGRDNIREIREELSRAISRCYSTQLSTCPNHSIFQPQKFINMLLTGKIKTPNCRLTLVSTKPKLPHNPFEHYPDIPNPLNPNQILSIKEIVPEAYEDMLTKNFVQEVFLEEREC